MKKNIKGIVLCLSVFLMILLVNAPCSWADGHGFLDELSNTRGIGLGALKVHPGIRVQETHDDNIFNTSEDEKEDFINTATPGLLLSLGDRYRFEIGYAVDIHSYSDFTDEDFTSQAAMAGMHLDFAGGLDLEVSDRYTDTKDVRAEIGQIRASHIANEINADVTYLFPGTKLSIGLTYAHYYLKFDQDVNRTANRREHTPGAAIYYRFLPKTSLLLEYSYNETDFFDSLDESTDADSKSHAGNLGLAWEPTAKLSGRLAGGWRWKEYDNEFDSAGNEYGDEDLWVVSTDMTYDATEKTMFSLMLARSLDETIYSGNGVNVSNASHYTNTGGRLGISQRLDPKVTLSAGASYNENEYNNLNPGLDERRDDIVGFDIEFGYEFREWLYAVIGYYFSETDSNDESRDERHNSAFASVALAI
jgi:hypothetical protein